MQVDTEGLRLAIQHGTAKESRAAGMTAFHCALLAEKRRAEADARTAALVAAAKEAALFLATADILDAVGAKHYREILRAALQPFENAAPGAGEGGKDG